MDEEFKLTIDCGDIPKRDAKFLAYIIKNMTAFEGATYMKLNFSQDEDSIYCRGEVDYNKLVSSFVTAIYYTPRGIELYSEIQTQLSKDDNSINLAVCYPDYILLLSALNGKSMDVKELPYEEDLDLSKK